MGGRAALVVAAPLPARLQLRAQSAEGPAAGFSLNGEAGFGADDEYVVEEVRGGRCDAGAGTDEEYPVKWKGFDSDEDGLTWEPAANIEGLAALDLFYAPRNAATPARPAAEAEGASEQLPTRAAAGRPVPGPECRAAAVAESSIPATQKWPSAVVAGLVGAQTSSGSLQ